MHGVTDAGAMASPAVSSDRVHLPPAVSGDTVPLPRAGCQPRLLTEGGGEHTAGGNGTVPPTPSTVGGNCSLAEDTAGVDSPIEKDGAGVDGAMEENTAGGECTVDAGGVGGTSGHHLYGNGGDGLVEKINK